MTPQQLIVWRKAAGLSRETAAKLLGCSSKSLERYESGKRLVPDEIAAATLTMGKTADAGVELAPPHDPQNFSTWDCPSRSPRLWRRMPGKKLRYERIPAGQPMRPADATYDISGHKPEGDPLDHGVDPDTGLPLDD
jgi:transcriptional regulator with XRE-family HTH domain